MLIYQCSSPLNDSLVGESGPCHSVSSDVRVCRSGLLIAGWAVGGEVFNYLCMGLPIALCMRLPLYGVV